MAASHAQRRAKGLPLALQADIDAFLIDHQARNLCPRTVAWYEQKLALAGRLLAQDGVEDVANLTPTHLRRLVLEFGESHRPGATTAPIAPCAPSSIGERPSTSPTTGATPSARCPLHAYRTRSSSPSIWTPSARCSESAQPAR
jgi:hypothetical protein